MAGSAVATARLFYIQRRIKNSSPGSLLGSAELKFTFKDALPEATSSIIIRGSVEHSEEMLGRGSGRPVKMSPQSC
jgi:hypothetical protein